MPFKVLQELFTGQLILVNSQVVTAAPDTGTFIYIDTDGIDFLDGTHLDFIA